MHTSWKDSGLASPFSPKSLNPLRSATFSLARGQKGPHREPGKPRERHVKTFSVQTEKETQCQKRSRLWSSVGNRGWRPYGRYVPRAKHPAGLVTIDGLRKHRRMCPGSTIPRGRPGCDLLLPAVLPVSRNIVTPSAKQKSPPIDSVGLSLCYV